MKLVKSGGRCAIGLDTTEDQPERPLLKMNLGNQIGLDLALRNLFLATNNLRTASLQLTQQLVEIDPLMKRAVLLEITAAAVVKLDRPTGVPIAEMMEKG